MTKLLFVFIDDEPESAFQKIQEIQQIKDKEADVWLLFPGNLSPTKSSDLISLGVTEIFTDQNRTTLGYSRRDFVQWCKKTLASQMFRTVAIFIDYMIDVKHPSIKHWQYNDPNDKLEGMRELVLFLRPLNSITKLIIFTGYLPEIEYLIDGTVDKSKPLEKIQYISDAYSNLTKRLSVKHKTAWLDRHKFSHVHNKTLLHCLFNPAEAKYACHINLNYLKKHIAELAERYYEQPICWFFPSCISTCDCDEDEINLTKSQDAWGKYYLEFCLFRNPDFSILYSILQDRNSARPRNNATIVPGIFEVIRNEWGLLQLKDFPQTFNVSCEGESIQVLIDNSLRITTQVKDGETTSISRMDNQVSGRHIEKQYYCVLYPWEADKIGQKIFDNLFPQKYQVKQLTIKSYADLNKQKFTIELIHECEAQLLVNPILKDDSFLTQIGADYALKNENNIFTFKIELPIRNYGIEEESPWRD